MLVEHLLHKIVKIAFVQSAVGIDLLLKTLHEFCYE
jgi:hypothetical protein